MALVIYILFIISSYLLGAIPFMILISRARGVDISHEPDLHQAMWYKVGRRWGLLGVLLDVLKGVVPVVAGLLLQFPLLVTVLAGLAATCGQMWPVFRKFDGERGNTTGGGMILTLTLALNGIPTLIIAVCFVILGIILRTITRWQASGATLNERLRFKGSHSMVLPLLVMAGFASCPITAAIFGLPIEMTLSFLAILILLLIRRVTAGLMSDLSDGFRWNVIVNRLLYDRSEL
ncbi:MAG: glycerol-3-phosphate acyltransferase [Dehalococcoidia bacterium]|jgi:acyl phosphate:glycerol-3-phosphate acyltransferase